MNAPFDRRRDRRLGRRLPVMLPARMETMDGSIDALCIDLGSDGLALRSDYVPRAGEHIVIAIQAPDVGGQPSAPLRVKAEVRRCNSVGGGLFEIGFRIIERHG
ncbi:MAG: PilZ domain-containing protein [Microvirgula sp.]